MLQYTTMTARFTIIYTSLYCSHVQLEKETKKCMAAGGGGGGGGEGADGTNLNCVHSCTCSVTMFNLSTRFSHRWCTPRTALTL